MGVDVRIQYTDRILRGPIAKPNAKPLRRDKTLGLELAIRFYEI